MKIENKYQEWTCPSCGYKDKLLNITYLKAGFNGIDEGDADDVDMLECNNCGDRFDYPEEVE